MLKCGICGKECGDYLSYAMHVESCAKEQIKKEQETNMQKINEELEELKRIKTCYEGMRDSFKKKYPDIYKANFSCSEEHKCNCGNSTAKAASRFEEDLEDKFNAKHETNQNKVFITTIDKNGKKKEKEIPFDSKFFEDLLVNSSYSFLPFLPK